MYVGNYHAFGLSEFVRSFGYRFYSNDSQGLTVIVSGIYATGHQRQMKVQNFL